MKSPFLDRRTARYLSLGAEIAGALVLPIWIGYKLDGWLDSSPWFLLLGAAAGLVLLFSVFVKLAREDSDGSD